MGACVSCNGTAEGPTSTAKLILPDGGLKEFDWPVRASSVNPAPAQWFVCDGDEMEFDAFVSAVGPDDLLRPGQIYFLLPRSMLKNPLRAEEVAALAVKASAALRKNSPPCRRSSVAPLVFPETAEEGDSAPAATSIAEGRRRRRRRTMSGGRLGKFSSDLSAIPE